MKFHVKNEQLRPYVIRLEMINEITLLKSVVSIVNTSICMHVCSYQNCVDIC